MQGTLDLHGSEDKSRHEEVYTTVFCERFQWDRQGMHSLKCSLARCGEKVQGNHERLRVWHRAERSRWQTCAESENGVCAQGRTYGLSPYRGTTPSSLR